MPTSDPEVVCLCGARMRAPGAFAGRVGRCPACGQPIQFGVAPGAEPLTESAPVLPMSALKTAPGLVTSRPAEPVADVSSTSLPLEPLIEADYDFAELGLEPVGDEPRVVKTNKTKKARAATGLPEKSVFEAKEPVTELPRLKLAYTPSEIRPGLVRLLKYPYWDETGLLFLIALPPFLALTSLFSIGLIPYLFSGEPHLILGATLMIIPAAALLFNALGFALIFFRTVIYESALGHTTHPKRPEWSAFGPLLEVLLWMLAGLPFTLLALFAIRQIFVGTISPTLWVALFFGFGCFGTLTLVSMLAYQTLEDLHVFNPLKSLQNLAQIGWRIIGTILAIGACALLGLLIVKGLFQIKGLFIPVFGTWLTWIAFLALGMGVAHDFGARFALKREKIRWFRT